VLGCSPQTVRDRFDRGELAGFRDAEGRRRIPATVLVALGYRVPPPGAASHALGGTRPLSQTRWPPSLKTASSPARRMTSPLS
jgi:hypothetical protein